MDTEREGREVKEKYRSYQERFSLLMDTKGGDPVKFTYEIVQTKYRGFLRSVSL